MAIPTCLMFFKVGLVMSVASSVFWVGAWTLGSVVGPRPDAARSLATLDSCAPSPDGEFCSLAVSPDGRLLAVGLRGGTVQLWEAATRRPRLRAGRE